MANLKLEHIYKVYPNGAKAVSDFTMDIKDQEFIVFVGPSGCGKSTTLRMIAGLEDISAGELYIGDRVVNDVEPKDRDIAMVFQNYALYPHMTVYENMAFGLKLRHYSNEYIHERVLWAAKVLGLVEYLDRKPKAMSGGQRQRVSLGRAILRNPKVMLLDEPLSNLDAKLRAQMRSEISKLHQQLKTTFIYVTHDQVEAMTLGTRVVVMKLGRIQQVDTPKNLYDYPTNKFVAGFIGTPQMNFFEGTLLRKDKSALLNLKYSDENLNIPLNELVKIQPQYLDGKHELYIGLRCENLSVEPEIVKTSKTLINVKVSHFEELGNETLIYADLNKNGDGFEENSTRVIIKSSSNHGFNVGDMVKVHVDVNKIHYFDKNTEECVVPRIPHIIYIDSEIENGNLIFDDTKIKLPTFVKTKKAHGLLTIPMEAITLCNAKERDFEATVKNIENINGKNIVHLLINSRILFIETDEKLKIGSKVNVALDLTKITFVDDKNNTIIKPLPVYDRINSLFVNYETAKSKVGDKFDYLIKTRIDNVTKEFDEKSDLLNKEYAKLLSDASKLDYEKIKTDYAAKILDLKNSNNEKLKDLKANFENSMKELKSDNNAKNKFIKDDVNDIYNKRFNEEFSTYKLFLKENKDIDAKRKRKQEHSEFKENNPREKENDLQRRLTAEALEFDTNKNALKGNFKREKDSLKNELKTLEKEAERNINLIKVLQKELKEKNNKLDLEKNESVKKAKMLFFFKVNDVYIPSTEVISNKMIQGLGIKVFSKDFLVEIPHDEYEISNDGIESEIVDVLDYGKYIYFCAEVLSAGAKVKLYAKSKGSKLKIGDKIKIKFDLTKCHITEKAMDIRIY